MKEDIQSVFDDLKNIGNKPQINYLGVRE